MTETTIDDLMDDLKSVAASAEALLAATASDAVNVCAKRTSAPAKRWTRHALGSGPRRN